MVADFLTAYVIIELFAAAAALIDIAEIVNSGYLARVT